MWLVVNIYRCQIQKPVLAKGLQIKYFTKLFPSQFKEKLQDISLEE